MPDPTTGPFGVDDEGVRVPADFDGSVDVLFDDHHAWSFTVHRGDDRAPAPGGSALVGWPPRMRGWLQGRAEVRLLDAGGDDAERDELWRGEVALGSGEGRIAFVDRQGIPVMIDKWGLLQRPFSGRGRGVVDHMVDVTEQILQVMRDDCGLEAWIAFGTLLGAAREGGVIGHDSDIDLAYLSHRTTPAEMVGELYDVTRALRAAGLEVLAKSGSFVTVLFTAPDGGQGSIDVYTCFYVGDLLHETATVRQVVPLTAIEPLGQLEFEGRLLPAPADPDRMLQVSYGPSWRVPDPSFQHTPGPEVTDRFHDWFGSLMRQRRDWERALASGAAEAAREAEPSAYAAWVLERTAPDDRLVEVGCGSMADALALARAGRSVLALDYARYGMRPAARAARQEGLDLRFSRMNLYDRRDVLTQAALVARDRRSPGRAVLARELLEALDPDGVEAFWRFTAMVLRPGGRLLLESTSARPAALAERRAELGGGRLRALDPRRVEADAVAAGGRVVTREGVLDAAAALAGGPPARWRMVVEWDAPPSSRGATATGAPQRAVTEGRSTT
ncbi:class I SAM-dependent methyltransferase [Nocardioides perillae]|uniref:Methyltransferase domain-containing protein n=1 Tax=Nocardioides perillae TaxID=1119534 RepID=A0A7Y9RRX6_9ACTN|nr:class I SAM-dependent methyltransferase [Nocardioides perillae]NYG55225.1 hypothetical protein [Nocardioides perillae]